VLRVVFNNSSGVREGAVVISIFCPFFFVNLTMCVWFVIRWTPWSRHTVMMFDLFLLMFVVVRGRDDFASPSFRLREWECVLL
jgi:hypothetical protein